MKYFAILPDFDDWVRQHRTKNSYTWAQLGLNFWKISVFVNNSNNKAATKNYDIPKLLYFDVELEFATKNNVKCKIKEI